MCSFSMFLFASDTERKKKQWFNQIGWWVQGGADRGNESVQKNETLWLPMPVLVLNQCAHGAQTCYEIWYLHTFADFRLILFLQFLFANKKGRAVKGHCLRRIIATAHSSHSRPASIFFSLDIMGFSTYASTSLWQLRTIRCRPLSRRMPHSQLKRVIREKDAGAQCPNRIDSTKHQYFEISHLRARLCIRRNYFQFEEINRLLHVSTVLGHKLGAHHRKLVIARISYPTPDLIVTIVK